VIEHNVIKSESVSPDSGSVPADDPGRILPPGVSGAADPHFASAIRAFSLLFPGHRFGGGALAVYLDGHPVVDVWTGWSDRQGVVAWTADTGAMVFSASKGLTSTVIHRLVDRGLLSYHEPVARYWPEFGANGKSAITVRDVLAHRAGLSQLNGVSIEEMLDHRHMEARMAAASTGHLLRKSAYHAVTYGWLMSGLARAVTGSGMRELFRTELAAPLNTDGIHLGRPPVNSPTRVAQILMPQAHRTNPVVDFVASKLATMRCLPVFGATYALGITSVLKDQMSVLDTEIPSINAVVTARGLAKMYGALANGGQVDGTQLLSPAVTDGLIQQRVSWQPDRIVGVPMSFHLGYHASPIPGLLHGFGHAGLGGSIGWADPSTGASFAFVHNRLLTPMVFDQAAFVALIILLRHSAAAARRHGAQTVADFGAPYPQGPTAPAQ
jgi:CubicO group peptidase (beta-lactamase class C family)